MSAAYLELRGSLPPGLETEARLRGVRWREDLSEAELDRCAFALQDGRHGEGPWAQELPTVTWPPLVVVAPARPSLEHLERARRQGASLIVTGDDLPELFKHPSGRALLRSGDWFQASLQTLNTADALQMSAMNRRTGVLTVTCAHTPAIGARPWAEGAGRCRGDDGCPGFIGRVVLDRGQVLHAETPKDRGIDALSAMLGVSAGQIRLHEVFVRPPLRTLQGSTAQILIAAAAREDERREGRPVVTDDLLPPDDAEATDPGTGGWAEDEVMMAPAPSPGVDATALVDEAGGVRSSQGALAPGLGPAAARCARDLSEACESLGLGELQDWVRLGEDAVFARTTGPWIAVGRGAGIKHAFRRLEAFRRSVTEGDGA